jgi:hypothetical protein
MASLAVLEKPEHVNMRERMLLHGADSYALSER